MDSIDVSELTRPVWVVSDLKVPAGDNSKDYEYEELFRGQMIKVPANGVKKVRMAYLTARKFLQQVNGLYDPFPNGGFKDEHGNIHKERFGKPLRILELTPQERLNVDGMTQEEIEERRLNEEASLSGRSQKVEGAVPVSPDAAPRRGRKPRMTEAEAVEAIGVTF